MSEERIQEIKDSINFQYELIVSKGINKNALLFTDEEQELLEEVERLNNIINELEKESYLGMIENQNNNDYAKGLYTAYKYINDKLQELKGSDSNGNN